jgi:hypothetical protein
MFIYCLVRKSSFDTSKEKKADACQHSKVVDIPMGAKGGLRISTPKTGACAYLASARQARLYFVHAYFWKKGFCGINKG